MSGRAGGYSENDRNGGRVCEEDGYWKSYPVSPRSPHIWLHSIDQLFLSQKTICSTDLLLIRFLSIFSLFPLSSKLILGAEFCDKEKSDLLLAPILKLLSFTPNMTSAVVHGMWGNELYCNLLKGLATLCPRLHTLEINWQWCREPLPREIDVTFYPTSFRLKCLQVNFNTTSLYLSEQESTLCRVAEALVTACMDTLEDVEVSLTGKNWENVASIDFDELPIPSHVKKFSYTITPGFGLSLANMMLIDLEAMGRKFSNVEELCIGIPLRKLPVVMQDLLVPAIQQLTRCRSLCFDFNTSGDIGYQVGFYGAILQDEIFDGFCRRKAIIQSLAVAMPSLQHVSWPLRHMSFDIDISATITRTMSPAKRIFFDFHMKTDFHRLRDDFDFHDSVVLPV